LHGITGPNDALNTVTVDGKVYFAPAVNYILYGRLMRLFYSDPAFDHPPRVQSPIEQMFTFYDGTEYKKPSTSYAAVIGTVRAYRSSKSALVDGQGVNPFVAWTRVGYLGDWNLPDSATYKKPGYTILPSKIPFKGVLHWVAGWSFSNADGTSDGMGGIINFMEEEKK